MRYIRVKNERAVKITGAITNSHSSSAERTDFDWMESVYSSVALTLTVGAYLLQLRLILRNGWNRRLLFLLLHAMSSPQIRRLVCPRRKGRGRSHVGELIQPLFKKRSYRQKISLNFRPRKLYIFI